MQEMRDKKTTGNTENKQHNDRSPSISVTALNINELNSPIKRQRLWIGLKHTIQDMLSIRDSFETP